MSRCKEFYEKWEREPNWCEKCSDAVRRIDDYIELAKELEQRGVSKEQTIVGLSEGAARPLIRENDPEIKEKAIEKISNDLKGGQRVGRGHKKKLTTGDVKKIINEVKKEKLPAPPLPTDKYKTIVIDPPWPVENIDRDVRPKQGSVLEYPVMNLEDIEQLPISELADSNGCHVFLWVTQKFLPDGLRFFERWGVKYQCLLTWVKPTGITPYSWMYNTEHVLFGRIGSLQLEKLGIKLSFNAPVVKHSQKPDIFYEIVKTVSPANRLEMFARQNRDGFEVWGNEV